MSRTTPREPEYRMALDAVKREGDRRLGRLIVDVKQETVNEASPLKSDPTSLTFRGALLSIWRRLNRLE
jgi:hypothetical protein